MKEHITNKSAKQPTDYIPRLIILLLVFFFLLGGFKDYINTHAFIQLYENDEKYVETDVLENNTSKTQDTHDGHDKRSIQCKTEIYLLFSIVGAVITGGWILLNKYTFIIMDLNLLFVGIALWAIGMIGFLLI